jgi:hypothetical protein
MAGHLAAQSVVLSRRELEIIALSRASDGLSLGSMAPKKTFPCPACGEEVPAQAKACPHCGACEKSGWGDGDTDGLDLPGEDFDYEKFTEAELGTPRQVRGKQLLWKITAVALLVLFIVLMVFNSLFR